MKQSDFLLAATQLKRNSGQELETIGMESETRNISITIYADLSDNYELVVEEICEKVKGEWIKLEPTESQEKILKLILDREIHLVQEEIQNNALLEDDTFWEDTDWYGTLYNNSY